MSDHPATFSHFVRASDLPPKTPRKLAIEATPEQCTGVAADLGLKEIDRFAVAVEIAPIGDGVWRVSGDVSAKVTQACVVTLAPVTSHISEGFERIFSRYAEEDTAIDIDIEYDQDDPPEPLGDGVDLGAVATEALALGLDPYPRAPGAAFETISAAPPGAEPLGPDVAKPFAGLASLKKAMESPD